MTTRKKIVTEPQQSREPRKMKLKEKIQICMGIILLITIMGLFFNWSPKITEQLIQWTISILIGIITSAIAGKIIESFTGNILKKIFIPITIGPIKFSISMFFIITILVKILLFN